MSTPLPTPIQGPSSSNTLWATASKEWVIPPKPKPGRKPKKDPVPAEPVASEVDGARRGQNRAAQRAFRTRKQEQLQELQTRLQQYEQGEIERNVALQNVAKRLKEDNDRLRKENQTLREQLRRAEDVCRESERKRAASPSSETTSSTRSGRKRARITVQSLVNSPPASVMSSYTSAVDTLPALTLGTPSVDESIVTPNHEADSILNFTGPPKPSAVFESSARMTAFSNGCGLCAEDSSCICREIGLAVAPEESTFADPSTNRIGASNATTGPDAPATVESILDNLPAFQPAVPLRRRNANSGGRVTPVFSVVAPAPASDCGAGQAVASCSGDPSNCAACADDSFGQAFCTAVGESLASSREDRCSNCPGRAVPGVGLPEIAAAAAADACCGGVSGVGCCRDVPTLAAPAPQLATSSSVSSGTIPCDQAWQQIKAHPNASFADLRLLADVVARRSKCTGPRVVISPAPGTATPDRVMSPGVGNADRSVLVRNSLLGVNGEQEIHIKCGRPSVRELPAEAVRDALRLLEIMHPRT